MKNLYGTSMLVAAVLSAGVTGFAMAQDECSTAATAVVGPNAFSTANATTSPEAVSDATCADTYLSWGTANKDIWFQFTAPSNGNLNLDTCFAGSFDTSVVVYTGSCGSLTQVACNGDGTGLAGCQAFYSNVPQIAAVGGTTYYIRIGGYTPASGVSESGAGQLNLAFQAISDGCVGATGGCGEVHASGGCDDAVCCSAVCDFDPSCCTDTWSQPCVDAAVEFCGIFVYNCTGANPAVANDCATAATVLTGDTFRDININGCNTDGPNHSGDTCNSGNDVFLNDVWFRFQAVANGTFRVQTCGVNGGPVTTFDSKLAIYAMGTNPAAFDYDTLNTALIACNDDGDTACAAPGGIFPSDISTPVVSGNWYLVRAATYDLPGTARVTFDMPEPCQLPAQTTNESEACGADTNGGCNAGGQVEQLGLNQKVKGSFFITDDGAGGLTRDTDFYQITVPTDKQVTVSVFSASFVDVLILSGDIAAADCAGVSVVATGAGTCPTSTSICLSSGLYYVFVGADFDAGVLPCGGVLSEYLLQVDAVDASCPILVDQTCSNAGPDTTTTSVPQTPTGNFVQGCATGCGNGTGGSTDMMFAASFSGANLVKELNCVNFGVAALRSLTPAGAACGYYLPDVNIPGKLVIYRDLDGGAPRNPIVTAGDGNDLERIDSKDILIPGGVYMGNVEFDPPLCLENETTVVIVFETYNLFNGTNPTGVPVGAGYRTGIGVAVPAAGQTFPAPNVWGRYTLCTGAAQNVFAQFGINASGVTTYQWPIQMNGVAAGCGTNCPADLDGDGSVTAADLSSLLGSWGTPGGDIDGDGSTGAADLALLLGSWGLCQ